MKRPLKWVFRGLAGASVIVLLIIVAIAVVLNTQAGARWVFNNVDARIPGTLDIERFSGTLWAGLRIPAIDYRDSVTEIHVVDADLRIDWSSVATGRFVVSVLTADSIEYRDLAKADLSQKPFELLVDPLPVIAGVTSVDVGSLTLINGEERTEIRNIVVDSALMSSDVLSVNMISAVVEEIALSASDIYSELSGEVPLSLGIQWSLPGDSWAGRGTVNGSLAVLEFDHTVSGPYPASATGEIRLLHRIEPEFDVAVSWEQWSFGDYVLDDGEARVRGTANDYVAEYDLTILMPGAETTQVAGTADGNTEQLNAFNAHVTNPAGSADLDGSIAWQPSFVAEARIHASGFDPSTVVAELSGRLDADLHVSFDDSGNLDITDVAVTGVLNEAAMNARGNLSLGAEQVRCDNCSLDVGDNHIDVDGVYGADDEVLTFSVDAPLLELLWPEVSGSLEGQGQLAGTAASPYFTGELHGQLLRIDDWSAADVTIVSRASTVEVFDITATATSLSAVDTDFGSFAVTGKGTPESLDIDFDWGFRDLDISAKSNIQRSGDDIEGVLTAASVTEENAGRWSLSDEVRFRMLGSDVSIDPHVWGSEKGEFRVSHLSSEAGDVEIDANLVGLPLQFANSFLPANIQLNGSANADIDVTRENDSWLGTINWQQADTVLRVRETDEQLTEVSIPEVGLGVELLDGGARISAAMAIEPGVTGELDLALEELAADTPIVAELRVEGKDWNWIPAIFPSIDNVEGAISASVSASGPFSAPEFSGKLNWREGGLAVPALNVPVTDIDLTVSGSADGAATIAGSARAGDGDLTIDGRLDDVMLATRSVNLTLRGADAELVNWPEYHLWASPDLVVVGSREGWEFSGQLEIPRADIAVRELPDEAVMPSPDVVVVGREETVEAPTKIAGEATLLLGEQVHVEAFGLDTGLQGDLQVKMFNDRPTSAEGQVTLVDGIFSAYGQKLTIQEGTLTFTGPLDDPLVDVRAVRVIESIEGPVTAGILLQGRAQSLSSTVYSDPVMAEADALSYLVVGRPLSQATESEGGELSSAAVALGVRQAGRITQQIGQALGLDELNVSGDGGDTTALVAGKQLSSRLHARYAYGVFSRLGTLLIRYRLSQRLTLEAGAGEAQSIDVLYLVEKQ